MDRRRRERFLLEVVVGAKLHPRRQPDLDPLSGRIGQAALVLCSPAKAGLVASRPRQIGLVHSLEREWFSTGLGNNFGPVHSTRTTTKF